MTNKSKSKKDDDKGMIQDQFVFLIWSNLVFAKLFFARFLPLALLNLIDLDSLELASSRFTSRKGSDSFGDIFYKFRFKSGKRGVFALLIEHKSYYDRLVSFQILRYEAGVFELMEKEPNKYVDEDGLFPVPYSILLCQKSCPQFDDIVSKCEGLDYGVRTKFQEICFNKIDVDALLDEPLLHVALGLARFAGYEDQEKERRQGELLSLFRSLTNLDPMRRENLKETWKFILEVSFNYLSKITRNIAFDAELFKRELFNAKGEGMQSQIYDDVFEEFFGDKIQPYRDAVAEARAEATEARAEASEEKVKRLAAEAQVHKTDELFCSSMRSIIRNTLYSTGKAPNLPNDVLNRIERIKSYDFLGKLLSVASSPKDDYAAFLVMLEKGEKQGRFAVSN